MDNLSVSSIYPYKLHSQPRMLPHPLSPNAQGCPFSNSLTHCMSPQIASLSPYIPPSASVALSTSTLSFEIQIPGLPAILSQRKQGYNKRISVQAYAYILREKLRRKLSHTQKHKYELLKESQKLRHTQV